LISTDRLNAQTSSQKKCRAIIRTNRKFIDEATAVWNWERTFTQIERRHLHGNNIPRGYKSSSTARKIAAHE
jgi:hypothetical protein